MATMKMDEILKMEETETPIYDIILPKTPDLTKDVCPILTCNETSTRWKRHIEARHKTVNNINCSFLVKMNSLMRNNNY